MKKIIKYTQLKLNHALIVYLKLFMFKYKMKVILNSEVDERWVKISGSIILTIIGILTLIAMFCSIQAL